MCCITSILYERVYGRIDFDSTLQPAQLYQHHALQHHGPSQLAQPNRPTQRPSRRQQIIHYHHAPPFHQPAYLHLQAVRAVLLAVGGGVAWAGQFVGFADGDEGGGETRCYGSAEEEATSV